MERFDRLRTPTAPRHGSAACKMQRAMQEDAAVFRTQESLESGCRRLSAIWKELPDVRVTDRSMIWNSDLVETLELENLMAKRHPPRSTAPRRARKAAGAHAREDYKDARSPVETTSTGASTLAWVNEAGDVPLDFRPVHTELIAEGIDPYKIEPKARVY